MLADAGRRFGLPQTPDSASAMALGGDHVAP